MRGTGRPERSAGELAGQNGVHAASEDALVACSCGRWHGGSGSVLALGIDRCKSMGVERVRELKRHGFGGAKARVLKSRCRCWSGKNVSDAERVARACAQCRAEAGSVCRYWAAGASAAQMQVAWACECRSRI
jgi:hypothetical protein